jgi:hypothetical protein
MFLYTSSIQTHSEDSLNTYNLTLGNSPNFLIIEASVKLRAQLLYILRSYAAKS